MRLSIKNIGKLTEANIELNGITVIAGENNAGKSTIGKSLFAMFNSLYNFDSKIMSTRINFFSQDLANEFEEYYGDYQIDSMAIAKEIFAANEDDIDIDYVSEIIERYAERTSDIWISDDDDGNDEEPLSVSDEFAEKILNSFTKFKHIDDASVYANTFNIQILQEFDMQINNMTSEMDEGNISLIIKNKECNLTIKNNRVSKVSGTPYSLKTEILYLDDPFILDNIFMYYIMRFPQMSKGGYHKKNLLKKLLLKSEKNDVETAFKELVVNERLEKILSKINPVCNGSLSYSQSKGFKYKVSNSDSGLSACNISTGLKTFIIIKTLLLNGSLEENGTIILDEPEIHLHPEWQLTFAEIIVLLQKEYKMHILLNTHSPYFLRAIEVYSAKYDIADRCKYYMAENIGEYSQISDVTTHTDDIYIKLAKPLENLQIMGYEND